jgi:hypothetical protein
MAETFRIYIDESGCEGFSFDRGSAEWFIIAALLIPADVEHRTRQLVTEFKSSCRWPPKKALHFRDLTHENRIGLIRQMVRIRNSLRCVAVAVHKPSLYEPEAFKEQNRLYFYAARYLLERASWLCRDARVFMDRKRGDGTAHIVFSERTGMNYESFAAYMRRLESSKTNINWAVIRPSQITAATNGKQAGLQLADAVASGFGAAFQPSKRDAGRAHEYACGLTPILYKSQPGKHWGYGIKAFPKECSTVLGRSHLRWVDAFRQ